MRRSVLVYSEQLAKFQAYDGYPWFFERSDAALKLMRRHGLVDRADVTLVEPAPAPLDALRTFHAPGYLDALQRANAGVAEEQMLEIGLGTTECPVYPGCLDYHRLVVGSALRGVEALGEPDVRVVFVPSAGMHHAGPDFAAGFCYLNDPVLAIQRLLAAGRRVFYLDIDAHHGDQVQQAFYRDDRVLKVSLHESPETLFPFRTGFVQETGEGPGAGYNVNLPFAAGTGDEVYLWGFRQVVPPLFDAFKPDVVVAEIGVDVLANDPMTNLALTTKGYCDAVQWVRQTGLPTLVLGGGGYLRDSIARGWTLAWAILNDVPLSDDAELLFGGAFRGDGLYSLLDRPIFLSDESQRTAWAACRAAVDTIKANQFRTLGIAPGA
jgi:acetoin utilization protein AcuC